LGQVPQALAAESFGGMAESLTETTEQHGRIFLEPIPGNKSTKVDPLLYLFELQRLSTPAGFEFKTFPSSRKRWQDSNLQPMV
jgi:hypothetical protein